jgi:two-component system, LytTR family, response regulator
MTHHLPIVNRAPSAIRALIVEDEPLSRRALHQMLARHADVEILGECCDGVEAAQALGVMEPDVVFLDIRMPERSGLDVARAAARAGVTPLIVYVTAFDEFAVPAFETDAVDYLLKPVTEDRFDAALQRVRERLALQALAASRTTESPRYADRLRVHVRGGEVLIATEAVDYFAADDVYARVHAAGKRYLMRVTLDALERELDPAHFVRVHRSYIVRIGCIVAIRRQPNGNRTVRLANGARIPVSRRRRQVVDEVLAQRRVG